MHILTGNAHSLCKVRVPHDVCLHVLDKARKTNSQTKYWVKLEGSVRNRTFICKGLTVTRFFSHPTLKACDSPYMQYYFKRFFVLHSSEVIFLFLIKNSRQKAIEIETEFVHFLGNPKGRTLNHFESFMLHISVITSPTN